MHQLDFPRYVSIDTPNFILNQIEPLIFQTGRCPTRYFGGVVIYLVFMHSFEFLPPLPSRFTFSPDSSILIWPDTETIPKMAKALFPHDNHKLLVVI